MDQPDSPFADWLAPSGALRVQEAEPYSAFADWLAPSGALRIQGAEPYSAFADWLSKFHTSSEPIQALWIVALAATILGVTWIVMRGLRELVSARNNGRGFATHRDRDGRWVVHHHGAQPTEWASAPPDRIGEGVPE